MDFFKDKLKQDFLKVTFKDLKGLNLAPGSKIFKIQLKINFETYFLENSGC